MCLYNKVMLYNYKGLYTQIQVAKSVYDHIILTTQKLFRSAKQGQVRLVLARGTSWESRMFFFWGEAGNHMIMVI